MNPDTATRTASPTESTPGSPTESPDKLKHILDAHPSLSEHERHEVANQLQATLVDLIDLSLIGKQMHWNVVGPHFRSLHLALDEFIDAWRLLADTVAERVTALGLSPDGRAATIERKSEIAAIHDGPIKDSEVIRELTTRLAYASAKLSERIERVGELDPPSQDVLIEVARTIDENHWMTAAQQG